MFLAIFKRAREIPVNDRSSSVETGLAPSPAGAAAKCAEGDAASRVSTANADKLNS